MVVVFTNQPNYVSLKGSFAVVQPLSYTCTVAFKVSFPTLTINEYKRQYACIYAGGIMFILDLRCEYVNVGCQVDVPRQGWV